MRRFIPIVVAMLWASPSPGAVISDRPDSVTITIYHEGDVDTAQLAQSAQNSYTRSAGLAFITELRTIDLPAGQSAIEFRDVTSTIVPQTADIQGLPAGVLERNFDYDLLSPGSVLAKSIGQTVRLVRTEARTGRQIEQSAVIRSAPDGVMLEIDGKYEALSCSGLPEKLLFDKVPDGLRDTPTFSVRTEAPKAGRYTITLSYIATGLNWSADYIARIRPDGNSLDLSGWITLANFSATDFAKTPVEVVAGRTQLTGQDQPVDPWATPISHGCWPLKVSWAKMLQIAADFAGAPPPPPPPPPMAVPLTITVTASRKRIDPTRLADYKLYQLPEPTDVRAQQTKQVQFLDQEGVKFKRIYAYDVSELGAPSEDVAATVKLEFHNTLEAGLGKALPVGNLSVTEPSTTGDPVLIGQNRIRDTPEGLPFDIETGKAVDIRVHRRLLMDQEIGTGRDKIYRWTSEITVDNDKSVPAAFQLSQAMYDRARETYESLVHSVLPQGLVWNFTLAPGERKTIQYTIEQPED